MFKFYRPLVQPNAPYELNIMPVLDILSTLVVFLLLSAVWFQAGWFPVMGTGSANSQMNRPMISLSILYEGAGLWAMKLQENQKLITRYHGLNLEQLKTLVAKIRQQQQVQQAEILPQAKQSYQEVVQIIDLLNAQSISQVHLLSSQRGRL